MGRLIMNLARYILPGGSVRFWHTPIAPVFYDFQTLSDYYIDFTYKTFYKGPFDSHGVPLLNYRGNIGIRYNPCATAQLALGWYQRLCRGETTARERFVNLADWFVTTLTKDEKGRGFWFYDFDLDAYGVKSPWASALAQAQGIAVLLRAATTTHIEEYARSADLAYRAMTSPVEQGGLLRDGEIVLLEEIVADRPTAILDGYIFAMLGVRDYAFFTDNRGALELWDSCVRTLEKILPEYDLGYWSRADLYSHNPPMPASSFYHGLHIAQLKVLERLTGNPVFGEYAHRWELEGQRRRNQFRAVLNKIYFKLRHY